MSDEKYDLVRDMLQRMAERVSALELALTESIDAEHRATEIANASYDHAERWWATYNAAVSRLASAGTVYAESVHTDCVHIADVAHGPLK